MANSKKKSIQPRRRKKLEVQVRPFGFNDSTKELAQLGKLYLKETIFTDAAKSKHVSIILGRRGAGKTALAFYFKIDPEQPYDIYVDIDEPRIYSDTLQELTGRVKNDSLSDVVESIAQVWTLSIWCTLFSQLSQEAKRFKDLEVKAINAFLEERGLKANRASDIVRSILAISSQLIPKPAEAFVDFIIKINDILTSDQFERAKAEVLAFFDKGYSAVIVIDTLDQYNIRNVEMQFALGAMLQAVAHFANGEVHPYLEIKSFLPAELVSFLFDLSVPNVGKTFENPLLLQWRTKDLLRLVCWRLMYFLENNYPKIYKEIPAVDWDQYDNVRETVWDRFFPHEITNSKGLTEDSFLYIVRHTQLRPRQLIWVCNSIAQLAYEHGTFPKVDNDDVVRGVFNIETLLAEEVLNSYQQLYPSVRDILACLRGQPMKFQASHIDELAARSKKAWTDPKMPYDRNLFRQMVCALGIVGRQIKTTERYWEAEFEYALPDRLVLEDRDECVLHPMFYRYYQIDTRAGKMVYPVPPPLEHES